MKNKIPNRIINRKKTGFNVPNAIWIQRGLKEFVMDNLNKSEIEKIGIFDSNFVSTMLNDHFNKKQDHSHRIWGLLSFVLWQKKFLSKNFKRVLLEIQELSMIDQGKKLDEIFESYKADIEQVDDVVVIGVRY